MTDLVETDLVDLAADALRQMPPAQRDSVAQAVLTLSRGSGALDIDPEHLPYVLEGLAQIARGEYATDAEVAAAYRSFGA